MFLLRLLLDESTDSIEKRKDTPILYPAVSLVSGFHVNRRDKIRGNVHRAWQFLIEQLPYLISSVNMEAANKRDRLI